MKKLNETLKKLKATKLSKEQTQSIKGGSIALNTHQTGRTFQDRTYSGGG